MTRNQRNKVYKRAIKFLEKKGKWLIKYGYKISDGNYSMCNALYQTKTESLDGDWSMDTCRRVCNTFEEIKNFKPKGKRYGDFWFNTKDLQTRLIILDLCQLI